MTTRTKSSASFMAMKAGVLAAVMLAVAVQPAVAQEKTDAGSAKAAIQPKGSHTVIGTNLRGKHHGEVLVLKRDAEGPGGAGYFFNSLSIADDLTAEEFDKRFRALDAQQLKEQLGGDVVRLNGPRRSMYDSAIATAFDDGKVTMIGGTIPMYVYGSIKIPNLGAFAGNKQAPYSEITVQRDTQWIFNAGQPVYELVSPKGSVYVLQSASLQLNPDNGVEKLSTLGERLALPKGWQFRVRILEAQLIVQAISGSRPATIVLDEFENNWQRIDKP
jgi:hypothetical protein